MRLSRADLENPGVVVVVAVMIQEDSTQQGPPG